jgi:hypothetical protein
MAKMHFGSEAHAAAWASFCRSKRIPLDTDEIRLESELSKAWSAWFDGFMQCASWMMTVDSHCGITYRMNRDDASALVNASYLIDG